MTLNETLQQLQGLGSESIKKVLLKHGIPEPLYGVKVEELKKINKQVKTGKHELSLQLYDTGIYDAMYLAGLVAEPEKLSKKELEGWAKKATSPAIREYTVAWCAAESRYGMELALKWIDSKDDGIASTGWSTLSNILSITPDEELDVALLKQLLDRVVKTIHSSGNRTRHVMNVFVISAGSYVKELNAAAKAAAKKIGVVTVDMGGTACKVPDAIAYIEKVEAKGYLGRKKKSARCM
ncbi:MAG: DNA alkylation repair protein [Bacteroidetes bacterium]|nr:DNA alkylation repair protein [Bacteroidota bacterium]